MKHISLFFVNHIGKIWNTQAVILLSVGIILGLSIRGWLIPHEPSLTLEHSKPSTIEEAQIWTCSMHPNIRRDAPGSCPICGMDLVPVKKSAGGIRTISISPDVVKLMNLQTVPVTRRYVTAKVRMVGKIVYDQTRLAHITAWVSGRLDRLYVEFEGVAVKNGDHMAYIYSEELYTAQEELISAIRSKVDESTSRFIEPINLAESAREKLRLLGITEKQIKEIEQRGKPSTHLTIYSPVGGIVVEKMKQEGDRVRMGDRIYTVADLNHLWVQMDAYESDLLWLRYGQDVEFTTEAYPGEVFHGRIAFIDPILNEDTRTVKVRVNVSNSDGRLKPEMFIRAIVNSKVASSGRVLDASLAGKWISPMHPEIVKDGPGKCPVCGMPLVRAETIGFVTAEPSDTSKPLVIPVSAALLTGTRAIVYVQIPDAVEPTYEGREIVLGPRAGNYYLVKSGLKEDELVVTNGNFKLDSALQISAKPSMMTPDGGGGGSGHDHGSNSKTKTDGIVKQDGNHVGMVLPTQLKSQIHQMVQVVDEIGKTIETAELEAIRDTYRLLGQRIDSLSSSQLTGDMQAQLDEFIMLLKNDAVEGNDIKTIQDADRVFLVTKQHTSRLLKMFGLSHGNHQKVHESLDIPDVFRKNLSNILPAYLSLGKALAGDDFEASSDAIFKLKKFVESINGNSLKDKAAKRWELEHDNLSNIVNSLSEADNLVSLRQVFALLSEEVLTLHRTFGMSYSNQLFELHCPMAFAGRGASWVQADDLVRNPYYGASMLKCADRVEPLKSKSSLESKNHRGHSNE